MAENSPSADNIVYLWYEDYRKEYDRQEEPGGLRGRTGYHG